MLKKFALFTASTLLIVLVVIGINGATAQPQLPPNVPGLQLLVLDSLGAQMGFVMGTEVFTGVGPQSGFVTEVAFLDPATDLWVEIAITRDGLFPNNADLAWESTDCTGTPYILNGTQQEDLLMVEAEGGFDDILYYRGNPLISQVQIQSRRSVLAVPTPCESVVITLDLREAHVLDLSGLFVPPFHIE